MKQKFSGAMTMDEYQYRIDNDIEDQPILSLNFHDAIPYKEKVRLGNDLLSNFTGSSPFRFFCRGMLVASLLNVVVGGLLWWLFL